MVKYSIVVVLDADSKYKTYFEEPKKDFSENLLLLLEGIKFLLQGYMQGLMSL
jgi:hypothetical protein